jgi:hypothetical protein
MTMGIMSVDNYGVEIGTQPPNNPADSPIIRKIYLTTSEDFPFNNISINFKQSTPSTFGEEIKNAHVVNVNLPFRDFDPMYHLLQTEKPVIASWSANITPPTNNSNPLTSFSLGTKINKEPVGEGPRDFSS